MYMPIPVSILFKAIFAKIHCEGGAKSVIIQFVNVVETLLKQLKSGTLMSF